jgi:glyoxylase-like metal-dependent hydrolase (beta-lactamase superfamily II)
MRKRLLVALGSVGVALTPIALSFVGNQPPVDGTVLAGGATLVMDGLAAVYLVPITDREFALVDCGLDPEATAVRAELARRHLDVQAVTQIFLTHAHRDHLGGCQAFPRAALNLMAAEVPLLNGAPKRRSPFQHVLADRPSGLQPARALADGERVSLGELEVRAFVIPGHTDGSAAYVMNGELYLGDSAGATPEGTVHPAVWVFSVDQAQNERSLAELAARARDEQWALKEIAFGHTAPLAPGPFLALARSLPR